LILARVTADFSLENGTFEVLANANPCWREKPHTKRTQLVSLPSSVITVAWTKADANAGSGCSKATKEQKHDDH
jgi:hypothetical protein